MRFLSIFFSLLLSGGCSGRFHSIEPSTRTPKLYERTDFTVLLTADYRNAYLQEEVALDMPTTIVSACPDEQAAEFVDQLHKIGRK